MTEPSEQSPEPAYQVSARRHRPRAFADVVGQPHVVRTLENAIRAGRIPHAYLFSGIRGVGKTTVARILARALNCAEGPTPEPCGACEPCRAIAAGDAPDVLEIDGASNNSVDNVRDLTENIRYRPLAARYRIYIIDEVHMLSGPAFNALLKTLEEPPPHAVFVFATTETHKIPQTILSRCQHHAFRRISREEIAAHLERTAAADGLDASRTALGLIARAADGSLRDALSLLDQAVSFGGGRVGDEDVTLMLGLVDQAALSGMAGDVLAGDAAAALARLQDLVAAGQDLQVLVTELVEHFRNLLVCAVSDDPAAMIDRSADDVADLKAQAEGAPREVIEQVLGLLAEAQERCRRALAPRYVLEAALVRAAEAPRLEDLGDLLGRLEGLASGAGGAAPAPRPAAPARRAGPPAPQSPPPPRPEGPARAMAADAPAEARPAAPPPRAEAPADPEPPAAGPPASPRETWEAAVKAIRGRRRALAAYLEQGVVRSVSPTRVEVGFLPAYEVMLGMVTQPESHAFIREVTAEVAGHPVDVVFVRQDTGAPDAGDGAGSAAPATLAQEFEAREEEAQRREIERALELPFLREVVDTFGGEVVELRKAEPERP